MENQDGSSAGALTLQPKLHRFTPISVSARHTDHAGIDHFDQRYRSSSAATNSFAVSLAVLAFEPHRTIPPRNAETAAAIAPGSNRIAPTNIAASLAAARHRNPRG